MAWKTVDLQEQRVRFVVMAAGKSQSFSSLCAAFGISRPTGYLWRVAAPFDVGDPQSLNLYAYVRNNPENMIDPSGLCAEGIGSDQCRGFEFVIFWGWGSGRDDDRPRHRSPHRPPRHSTAMQRIGLGILPGETAGVPDWLRGHSDLSRWMIVNFQNGGRTWKNYKDYLDWVLKLLGPDASLSQSVQIDRMRQKYERQIPQVEAIVELTHILEGVGMVGAGITVAAIGVSAAATVCAGTGPLGCGAAVYGGALTVGGGLAISYAGWRLIKSRLAVPH